MPQEQYCELCSVADDLESRLDNVNTEDLNDADQAKLVTATALIIQVVDILDQLN